LLEKKTLEFYKVSTELVGRIWHSRMIA